MYPYYVYSVDVNSVYVLMWNVYVAASVKFEMWTLYMIQGGGLCYHECGCLCYWKWVFMLLTVGVFTYAFVYS